LSAASVISHNDVAIIYVLSATFVMLQLHSSDTSAPETGNPTPTLSILTSSSASTKSDSAKNFSTYLFQHSFSTPSLPAIWLLAVGSPKSLFSGTQPDGSISPYR
jgi:hypothetical protein